MKKTVYRIAAALMTVGALVLASGAARQWA